MHDISRHTLERLCLEALRRIPVYGDVARVWIMRARGTPNWDVAAVLPTPRVTASQFGEAELAIEALRRSFRLADDAFDHAPTMEARPAEARIAGHFETAIDARPPRSGVSRADIR